MARPFRSICARDLIALLEDQDGDAQVIVAADYGDRCNTEQALPLKGSIEEVAITPTAYSASGFAIADNDDHEDAERDGDELVTFLLIR